MLTIRKSILFSYGFAFLVIAGLGWYSWYLHRYYNRFVLVRGAFMQVLKEESNSISAIHHVSLARSVEQQLSCASSTDIDFVQRFKAKGRYPENALAYTLEVMAKMQTQIANIDVTDSSVTSTYMVGGGKEAIFITMNFAKEDNSLKLTAIQNICPLFKKVAGFEQNKAAEAVK